MKQYTTIDYILPVINEIKENYSIVNNSIAKQYFDCDLILKSNKNNEIINVSRQKDFYISGIHTLHSLFNEIEIFSDYCSTYSGELDIWEVNEKKNVLNAIKQELIFQYA